MMVVMLGLLVWPRARYEPVRHAHQQLGGHRPSEISRPELGEVARASLGSSRDRASRAADFPNCAGTYSKRMGRGRHEIGKIVQH
jgi:hypothetical protein